MHVVRSAKRRRGGVGQGVLTDTRFADAGLARRGRALHLAGVSLVDIAAEVGTPAYVYNAEAIRERYRSLDQAMAGVPHRICYAVKANSTLAVLRLLRDLGAGADIVSAGEMARALAAGFAPDRIVFSGVGKATDELRQAVRSRVGHLNVESLEELHRLAAIAEAEGVDVAVGIRVNPDVTTETHPYISTGKSGIKFGVPVDQVPAAAAVIAGHPRLTLTVHRDASRQPALGYRAVPAGHRPGCSSSRGGLRDGDGHPIGVIDVGGGLAIRYADETPMDPVRFAEAVVPLLAPTGYTVYLEPGRFLVGSAGVLLTEVLYRKHSGGKEFVVVDAGMNDLVRPSHYQAYHEIVELESRERPTVRADIVGPVCETGDFLALDRELPDVHAGDRLAVLGAGAYGFVMASNYNTRPRPAEVMVDGDRWWVARRRETVEDLFRTEKVLP